MASYHLQAKVIQRSHGRIVVGAYRAAEALHDEKVGRTHNYFEGGRGAFRDPTPG